MNGETGGNDATRTKGKRMGRKKAPKGGTLTQQARAATQARDDIVASATAEGGAGLLIAGIEDKPALTPAMHFEAEGITAPPPLTTSEAIDAVLQDRADHLKDAPVFLLSEEMLDVVIAAAKSLSPDDLAGLIFILWKLLPEKICNIWHRTVGSDDQNLHD